MPKKNCPKGGRPLKNILDCAERTKRKKVETLVAENSSETLAYAAQKSLRASGKTGEAQLIKEATIEGNAGEMIEILNNSLKEKPVVPFSPDEALNFIVEANLSKHQYTLIRLKAKEKNADIFPSYDKILEAKKKCYPPETDIFIKDKSATVKVQSLLNHTSERIMISQRSLFTPNNRDLPHSLVLISKWGADGSTGHSEYKQFIEGIDSSIYISSFVPLQLYGMENDKKIIIWQNPTPSSTRYCRPIRMLFQKESVDLINQESDIIQTEIDQLENSEVVVDNNFFSIRHDMQQTMIDGKVCNALTGELRVLKVNFEIFRRIFFFFFY